MRVLIDSMTGLPAGGVDAERLRALYAVPRLPWLRANMVQTLDGAATGANGVTGSINNPADKRVFDLLRDLADVVVVGAGTARTEGYGPVGVPIALVSRAGEVPERLRGAAPGSVLMVTCESSPALAETREVLGPDNVLVLGQDSVELGRLRPALVDRGFGNVLCEGGPRLLTDLLAVRAVDELCVTVVPAMVGGAENPRITRGPDLDVPLRLGLLLEESGTLLGRWLT